MYSVPDGGPGVDAALLAEEDRRLVNDGLDRLPDEAREVLLLFYREEQSVAQVATLLDLSEGAVKKRLSRARTALRGMVLDQLGDSLKRTAPGSAFTIAVMAALPLTMPLSASAAAAASKMTPAALSTGWWAWLLWVTAPFAGAVLGLIGGVWGRGVWGAQTARAGARRPRTTRTTLDGRHPNRRDAGVHHLRPSERVKEFRMAPASSRPQRRRCVAPNPRLRALQRRAHGVVPLVAASHFRPAARC